MRYKLDVVTDESYLKSGRYVEVEANTWAEALGKGIALAVAAGKAEWVSRVTEADKREGEEGWRIVWDINCGDVGYYD